MMNEVHELRSRSSMLIQRCSPISLLWTETRKHKNAICHILNTRRHSPSQFIASRSRFNWHRTKWRNNFPCSRDHLNSMYPLLKENCLFHLIDVNNRIILWFDFVRRCFLLLREGHVPVAESTKFSVVTIDYLRISRNRVKDEHFPWRLFFEMRVPEFYEFVLLWIQGSQRISIQIV